MRRFLLLLEMLLLPPVLFAQGPVPPRTPNLGLYKPRQGTTNWGFWLNANADILDAGIPGGGIFISSTPNPALSGAVRLASGDQVCWRNNVNTTDLCISKSVGDVFSLNGDVIVTATATQTLTNKTLTSPVLVTPTIASFVNALHTHANAANGGQLDTTAIKTANLEGNGTKLQLFTGADPALNDCAKFDVNHNLVTNGAPCGGGATTLLVNSAALSGTANLSSSVPLNVAVPTPGPQVVFAKDAIATNNIAGFVRATPTPGGSRKWAYGIVSGSTYASVGLGLTAVGAGGCPGGTPAASFLPYLDIETTGVMGNVSSEVGANANDWITGHNLYLSTQGLIANTTAALCSATNTAPTNIRLWIGWTDQSAATMGASANPAGNYAAFRFDTSVPDTTLKCITKDNALQTIVDSTKTLSNTVFHTLEIQEDTTNGKYFFYYDGALVCTNSSHIPTPATYVVPLVSITTLEAAAKRVMVTAIHAEIDTR